MDEPLEIIGVVGILVFNIALLFWVIEAYPLGQRHQQQHYRESQARSWDLYLESVEYADQMKGVQPAPATKE